jgi:hypothetical protein
MAGILEHIVQTDIVGGFLGGILAAGLLDLGPLQTARTRCERQSRPRCDVFGLCSARCRSRFTGRASASVLFVIAGAFLLLVFTPYALLKGTAVMDAIWSATIGIVCFLISCGRVAVAAVSRALASVLRRRPRPMACFRQ